MGQRLQQDVCEYPHHRLRLYINGGREGLVDFDTIRPSRGAAVILTDPRLYSRHSIRREPTMGFLQDPPQLAHPYREDRLLRAMLDRALPPTRRAALDVDLQALGDY